MHTHAALAIALAVAGFACAPRHTLGGEGGARALTEDEIKAGRFALRTERLDAALMVPDQPSSAYEGPRYESGGVVMQVTLDGKHTFLGEEGRGNRLGGFGLIEEMGIDGAVGYEQAKPGEPFLKLGVGLVTRGNRPEYSFFDPLPVAERFPWQVTVAGRSATFVQLGKPFRGVAYRYEKRVVLDEKDPVLRIEHALTNTGEQPIATTQYCHDYFRFDDAAPGPDYVVMTRFPLVPEGEQPALRIGQDTICFKEPVTKAVYCRFKGQPPAATAHSFGLCHKTNELAIAIDGNFPIARFAYYADPRAASPEAFCAIAVKPGDTFTWTRTYAFR